VARRTAIPAGHHGGNNSRVESDVASTSIVAHPRPFGARGTRALSSGGPCPAACQSNGGVHEPNANPKHSAGSERPDDVAFWARIALDTPDTSMKLASARRVQARISDARRVGDGCSARARDMSELGKNDRPPA
jgi:hypothetical protein